MIYTDEFVWLHFPKCAGTKVKRLFLKYLFGHNRLIRIILSKANIPAVLARFDCWARGTGFVDFTEKGLMNQRLWSEPELRGGTGKIISVYAAKEKYLIALIP